MPKDKPLKFYFPQDQPIKWLVPDGQATLDALTQHMNDERAKIYEATGVCDALIGQRERSPEKLAQSAHEIQARYTKIIADYVARFSAPKEIFIPSDADSLGRSDADKK
jgi:hypothetical protein